MSETITVNAGTQIVLVPINETPEVTTLADGDEIVVGRGPLAKHISWANVKNLLDVAALGSASFAGVIDSTGAAAPTITAPTTSVFQFSGPGTYTHYPDASSTPIVLTEALNVVTWDGTKATFLAVPIDLTSYQPKATLLADGVTAGLATKAQGVTYSPGDLSPNILILGNSIANRTLDASGGVSVRTDDPAIYAISEFIAWGENTQFTAGKDGVADVLQSVWQYTSNTGASAIPESGQIGGSVASPINKYSGAVYFRVCYVIANINQLSWGPSLIESVIGTKDANGKNAVYNPNVNDVNLVAKFSTKAQGVTIENKTPNFLNTDNSTENASIKADGTVLMRTDDPAIYAISEFIAWGENTQFTAGKDGVSALLQSSFQYDSSGNFVTGSSQIGGVVPSPISKYEGAVSFRICYVIGNVNQLVWGANLNLNVLDKDAFGNPIVAKADITDADLLALITSQISEKSSSTISTVLKGNLQPAGQLNYPDAFDTDYIDIIDNGQSLSVAARTDLTLTTIPYPNTFMVGNRVTSLAEAGYDNDLTEIFNPLIATHGTSWFSEQSIITATNAFKKLFDRFHRNGYKRNFVACAPGHGGYSIELLSKECTNSAFLIGGTNVYTRGFLQHLNQAKAAADALSKTISCPIIIWEQGENNYTGTGQGLTTGTNQTLDPSEYKALLLTLKNNMQADVMGIYGQDVAPLFAVYQTSNQWIENKQQTITQALIEFADENDDCILLPPLYPYPKTADNHLSANGQRMYGNIIGKAMYNLFIRGIKDNHPRPINIQIIGKQVIIDYKVPVAPLVFEQNLMEAITNYGFSIYVNGNVTAITNIQIVGGTRVILTASITLVASGSMVEVTYGDSNKGGKGNLRDSDTWLGMYNYEDDSSLTGDDVVIYQPKDPEGNQLIDTNPIYPCYNWAQHLYYSQTF